MKKLSTRSIVHALILSVCLFLLAIAIGFYGVYLYIAPSVPDIASLKSRMIEMPLSVYSRDGKLIGVFGEKLSSPVTYRQIPPDFVHAFLAAEDASFFEHSGVSLKGLGRAVTEALQNTGKQTGGSTITMQVAKNFYLSPERTIKRKLTEVVLARKIEQNLNKKEIFTLYVNKIFFGQHAYGIAAASKVYFNKRLNQLTLAEMAMIAGLPKAPSKYNPVVNPTRALERRNWILGRMLQLGYITPQQYRIAVNSPITLKTTTTAADVPMPYLAEMVRNEMITKFGPDVLNMGWKVYTTVDSTRQLVAEAALKNGLEDYDRRHGYYGPEAHNKPLDEFYTIHDWQPAEVVTVGPNQFTALLKNDELATVPLKTMTWARKRINANATGPTPSSAAEVVKKGDIVRIQKDPETKSWKFGQIPHVQGQLVAMNPNNGALEAVVGGYHYGSSRFNRSTQGWRQAGSTIKPFIYTLALERGFTPYSIVNDSPLTIGRWSPQNSDGKFKGPIPLRTALYLSRNLVSIRLLQAVGINRARQFLEEFGFIRDNLPANLTLALGTAQVVPLQIANGYSAFANGGYRVQPYFIQEIDAFDGKKLYEANPPRVCATCVVTVNKDGIAPSSIQFNENYPQAPRIVKAGAAYDMANILRDVVQHGTARKALSLGRDDVGGKTGTTNDAKDAWFAGIHPTLVAVSSVGFDQPQTLGKTEFGGVAALPIWMDFMEKALKNIPRQWVVNPRAPASGKNTIEASRGFNEGGNKQKKSGDAEEDALSEPTLIEPTAPANLPETVLTPSNSE